MGPRVDVESDRVQLSVVIPVFNEKDSLSSVVDDLKAVCASNGIETEVIVVDDGSNDGTAELAAKIPDVTTIRFRRNFGQTAALDAGVHIAKYRYIVTMDGDGQNDPNDIPRLIAYLEDNNLDVVSGWRVKRKDMLQKRIISRGANSLRKFFLNDSINDSGCSLKIYRRECFENLRLYGEMHRFIPALLQMRGFSVGEMPVNHLPRKSGQSKYGAMRTIKGLVDMMLLWFWRSYSVRPIHLLGGLGVLFLAVAAFFGIRTVYLFLSDHELSNTLEPLLTVFTFITGLLFFSLGVLTDILIKIYYSITPEPYYSVRDVIENGVVVSSPLQREDGKEGPGDR